MRDTNRNDLYGFSSNPRGRCQWESLALRHHGDPLFDISHSSCNCRGRARTTGASNPQRRKAPLLGVKFDRDSQQLEFFLVHVLAYIQEYGPDFPTKGAKVGVVTLALEGAEPAGW